MAINRSDLIRAELDEEYDKWNHSYDFWASLVQWQSWWPIVAIIIIFFAYTTFTESRQKHFKSKISSVERKLEKFLINEEKSLLEKSETLWPQSLLLKRGAEKYTLENGFIVYSKVVKTDIEEGVELQIRTSDDEVLAHAYVSSFGSRLVWPFNESDGFLEDGSNIVEIKEAISNTGIGKHIRQAQGVPVEVIGIGLESSFGKNVDDRRLRSHNRGQELIKAVHLIIDETGKKSRITFRTLGLGKHTECAKIKNSEIERQQRSALIVVANLFRHEIVQLDIKNALKTILQDNQNLPIEISKYEGFPEIKDRLSVPIKFDGSGVSFWVPPPIKSLQKEECFPEKESKKE